ncbi:helix-turn-helix transcriptional regulator [Bacillus mycoides]|uniref:helix-turn-helix transcriptional regulator n=1 Tax=Bacillus mycoides TaxID=1405 RepID=UPI003D650BC2
MQILLYKLRKQSNLTQVAMGSMLNIAPKTYGAKERGEFEFTQDEMFEISNYFGKKIDDIFLPRCHQFGNLVMEGS